MFYLLLVDSLLADKIKQQLNEILLLKLSLWNTDTFRTVRKKKLYGNSVWNFYVQNFKTHYRKTFWETKLEELCAKCRNGITLCKNRTRRRKYKTPAVNNGLPSVLVFGFFRNLSDHLKFCLYLCGSALNHRTERQAAERYHTY